VVAIVRTSANLTQKGLRRTSSKYRCG
jgi:hypothetical protein